MVNIRYYGVHNGQKTRFKTNAWCNGIPFAMRYSSLFYFARNRRVFVAALVA